MTQEIGEHLRKLTSRNGRYWLRDSRHAASELGDVREELPFGSVKSGQHQGQLPAHESVVVSIPDVGKQSANVVTQTVVAAQETISKVTTAAPKVQQVPPAPHLVNRAKLKAQMPELAPVSASMASVGSSLVSAAQFSTLEASEVAESPAPVAPTMPTTPTPPPVVSAPPRVIQPAPEPQEDDAVKAARSTQSNGMETSISRIADEILKNFPIASSSVIMISGSQSALHADETCARVAAELASRNLGRVLLVDSDFETRRLTKASGMSSQGGLSEIMNIAFPWQDAVLKSGSSKLDFMAAGSCPHKRWTPKRLLREALAEMRNEYQFVCVSSGDAHGSAAALWSELSDGAVLVVSASQSSEAVAQSAVGQLKANGARMLGCVVADSQN